MNKFPGRIAWALAGVLAASVLGQAAEVEPITLLDVIDGDTVLIVRADGSQVGLHLEYVCAARGKWLIGKAYDGERGRC